LAGSNLLKKRWGKSNSKSECCNGEGGGRRSGRGVTSWGRGKGKVAIILPKETSQRKKTERSSLVLKKKLIQSGGKKKLYELAGCSDLEYRETSVRAPVSC